MRPRSWSFAAVLVVTVSSVPAGIDAQGRMNSTASQQLREAAALESRGDFEGAEALLRSLLNDNPTSPGGLYALERVLRAQGQIVEILPVVDAFLERDPGQSGVRSLKLRVLAEADSLDAVRSESEAWLESSPRSEVPWREVARVWERAFGADEALGLLRRGRERIGAGALALEIGDLLAAANDPLGAADEWAVAVGDDGAQVSTVTRRLQGLGEGADEAAARVVSRLADSNLVARRRAGARIALDLGVEAGALPLVREVADDLDGRARTTFLADAARRARDSGLTEVASWAYDELGADASSPAERRQFDQRIIDVALASGDTATALDAQRRVAASFSPGSVDRRRATAQVIRLEGSRSGPDELRAMLEEFRADFPNAPELDDLAATVAGALQTRGDPVGAAAVLDGITGPRSSLERAYLLLGEGQVGEGRSALLLAVTGLPPADATEVIQFAGLLGRLSPQGGSALAEAGVAAHRGAHEAGARVLTAAAGSLPDEERPLILAEAARMAQTGDEGALAAEIRTRIVEEYPDAPEVAEAALGLARWHARTPRGLDQAIRLLEDLIANRPNAAVVPDARVELQRLRSRG